MTKIAGSGSASGSISQRHGSADPDPDQDSHQNVTDPQHWFPVFQFLLEDTASSVADPDPDPPADLDGVRVLQGVQLQGDDENVAAELLPHLELGVDPIVIVFFRVVDPK